MAEEDIDLSDYKVTSEVHVFSSNEESETGAKKYVSKFIFGVPEGLLPRFEKLRKPRPEVDRDGDLDVVRKSREREMDFEMLIEHQIHTSLDLVGLQVWRGALLLADYLLYCSSGSSELKLTSSSNVVELGAGTGLTSVVAAMIAGNVISTDVDRPGILDLIRKNLELNKNFIQATANVCELNFYAETFSPELESQLKRAEVILAADVIYHDDLTDAFLRTLKKIMNLSPGKTALISVEKRVVFTIAELEACAPCFEYFYENLERVFCAADWRIEHVDNALFPQYFCYERVKELVLLKITAK
nr:EOG090X0C5G [Eulimnadia texana]